MTTPQPADLSKARNQMMTGAMLVMGACVFGGLTAVVLMAVGQRGGATIVAMVAGVLVVAGIVVQITGFRRMKAAGHEGTK